MHKTILVLGATGGIGGSVARAMLARGWQVTALTRDIAKAQATWTAKAGADAAQPLWIAGDAMCPDDVIGAGVGAAVIFHAVNPPGYRHWDSLALPMIDNTLRAAREHGARVALPGTIYNYDPAETALIDQDTPQRPRGAKGAIRVEMERRITTAAPQVRSLIVRAGDFFGPGVRQSWFTDAMVRVPLKRIINPGRDGVGHAWAYLPDLTEAIARLLELPDGLLGLAECLQFAGFWDHDGRQMIKHIRLASNRVNLPVIGFPWWLMRVLGLFGGFAHEAVEIAPYWRHAVNFDNTRLKQLLSAEPATPIQDAISHALALCPNRAQG